MMSAFALRLDLTDGDEIPIGAVTRIQGYADGAPKEVVYRQLSIPVSKTATARVEVPPGRYVIQAILPSGKILQEERRVGGEDVVTVVFASPPRRDWLRWQDYSAAMPQLDLPVATPVELSRLGRVGQVMQSLPYLDKILGVVMGRAPRRFPDDATGTASAEMPKVRIASMAKIDGAAAWNALALSPPEAGSNEAGFNPVRREGPLALYEISTVKSFAGRQWLVVALDDGVEVVSFPFPWHDKDLPAAELLVDQSATSALCRSSLVVRDGTSASLLAYLGRGNPEPALEVVHQVSAGSSMLSRSNVSSNPFVFCAASYIRLMNNESAPPEELSFEEGMELFPWLPDVAVIRAQSMIRNGDDRGNIVRALHSAYGRGIPYFAAGVQHLREALAMVAGEDAQLKGMSADVARIASRMDPGKSFTALRYSRPQTRQ
ncbi:hypothetical protein [Bradyrhizobium sp. HKCCYLR20261]|uniref:hypothetical protein n=1 Tax=Bradyrhizobium sp. HKCCYLR20261 TaxID=3420760 RepID=UPI003EC0349C